MERAVSYSVCCESMAMASSISSVYRLPSRLSSSFLRSPSRRLGCHRFHGGRSNQSGVRNLVVYAAGGRGEETDAADRLVAASGYFLPFLDGVQYGRYFFTQFPAAQVAFQPLYPLLRIYSSTPFASIGVFFALYFLVVRNQNFSRYVRFNTMQAVVLDVLLILPNVVEGLFHPQNGVGLEILVVFYNTIFLYLVACFLIGSGSCLLGKTPRLPLISDAADAQVM